MVTWLCCYHPCGVVMCVVYCVDMRAGVCDEWPMPTFPVHPFTYVVCLHVSDSSAMGVAAIPFMRLPRAEQYTTTHCPPPGCKPFTITSRQTLTVCGSILCLVQGTGFAVMQYLLCDSRYHPMPRMILTRVTIALLTRGVWCLVACRFHEGCVVIPI